MKPKIKRNNGKKLSSMPLETRLNVIYGRYILLLIIIIIIIIIIINKIASRGLSASCAASRATRRFASRPQEKGERRLKKFDK